MAAVLAGDVRLSIFSIHPFHAVPDLKSLGSLLALPSVPLNLLSPSPA